MKLLLSLISKKGIVFNKESFFIPVDIELTELENSKNEHEEEIVIKAVGFGETFSLDKHPQGTEVKAITYSAMQIIERPNFCETYVIIDI